METEFRCRQQIQMRFKDVDMFGHVNNTVYFEYMDYGKTQYIQTVLGDLFDVGNDALVIVNINCDFISPTRYDEPVEVLTAVQAIGKHSLSLVQRVVNSDTQEVKCKASVVMVGFNTRRGESIIIPPQWRLRISEYEGRPELAVSKP